MGPCQCLWLRVNVLLMWTDTILTLILAICNYSWLSIIQKSGIYLCWRCLDYQKLTVLGGQTWPIHKRRYAWNLHLNNSDLDGRMIWPRKRLATGCQGREGDLEQLIHGWNVLYKILEFALENIQGMLQDSIKVSTTCGDQVQLLLNSCSHGGLDQLTVNLQRSIGQVIIWYVQRSHAQTMHDISSSSIWV